MGKRQSRQKNPSVPLKAEEDTQLIRSPSYTPTHVSNLQPKKNVSHFRVLTQGLNETLDQEEASNLDSRTCSLWPPSAKCKLWPSSTGIS